MTVKELIKELQKHNPDTDVYFESALNINPVLSLKKIKVKKDIEESYGVTSIYPMKMEKFQFDRWNEVAMNTNNESGILLKYFPDYKKK